MVETFLSLWILLILRAHLPASFKDLRASAELRLGIVVGLAFLTKLTTVLFVPVPLVFALMRVIRGGPDRRILVKALAWSGLFCAAVAGPWYAYNASRAVKFRSFLIAIQ